MTTTYTNRHFSTRYMETEVALLDEDSREVEAYPVAVCGNDEEFESWASGEGLAAKFKDEVYVKVNKGDTDAGEVEMTCMTITEANEWIGSDARGDFEEVFTFFRAAYTRALNEEIDRAAEAEDAADSLLDGDTIEGEVLGSCDQTAYSETLQNFGWRIGFTEVSEAFNDAGPEVYAGIDFESIIKNIRKKLA